MKRHLDMPDGIKHARVSQPAKTWTGMYSPKRVRRLERREYEHRARSAEITAVMALKRGAEEKARALLKLAAEMKARATSLFRGDVKDYTRRLMRRSAQP